MKISYNWLKQFLETDWSAEKTAELLTDLGLEVEGITEFESVKGGLKGIVVGKVLSCTKHPNADRLNLCQVDLGNSEPVQIVCGAKNVAAGQLVPVATVGAQLYTPAGEAWIIQKGKIRGEVSNGMICAEDEIGLGSSHDGILVLDTEAVPGTPCAELFEVVQDQVFEIGLTPNRADAMSHFGVARDLLAGMKQRGTTKELITPAVTQFHVDNRYLPVEVLVEQPELAPRYCGITLSKLKVKASPKWLQNRLKAIGLNPINNIVDATNYVMHELGQPLHAFDASRILGNTVIVKTVSSGTKFMTLDGVEHSLHADDLMICDAEKPMCIAGVYGGINTGVTENTTSIFLESAYFDPVSIRKTAKRHGLNTDASFRFERGIDINNVEYALRRAAILIQEIAGGLITSELVDLYPKKIEDHSVFLTYEKITNLIGQEIPREIVISILASLDIQVKSVTELGLNLVIPYYRVDVRREVDVIEEILRVYGYNNIAEKKKFTASIDPARANAPHQVQNRISQQLVARGFYEILGNSLCNPSYHELLGNQPNRAVALLNPLSTELSHLRQDMLFSGLSAAAHNLNRQQQDLKLFEFGKIYWQDGDNRKEANRLSILASGNRNSEHWTSKQAPLGFFFLKGILSSLFESCAVGHYNENPLQDQRFDEGIQWEFQGEILAELGLVKKKFLEAFDVRQDVFYADIRWDLMVQRLQDQHVKFKEIARFPEVRRDLALLIDEHISFQELYQFTKGSAQETLKDVRLFDVYTGDKLPKGKKSYAMSFHLQDPEKTLTDAEIESVIGTLRRGFEETFGATLR
ncbi:MAG: hypothetical protein RLZZ241_156 [Bacteroidota bacterium]